MIKLSKDELGANIAFLHFLYLTKINKERKYINRNGKMPIHAERFLPKKGYKSVFYITLRKFIEGFLSRDLKITKRKDRDEYKIESKTANYTYGQSELIDSLVKIKLLNSTGARRDRSSDYIEKNHNFVFNCNNLLSNSRIARTRSPYQLTYKFNFDEKEQAFAPVVFENYVKDAQGLSEAGVVLIKNSFADLLTKSLAKLKTESFLRRKRTTTATREPTERAVETISTAAGLATKYRIPKIIVDEFIESYKSTMRQSEGLQSCQVFEYTKNVLAGEHNRISNLEFIDFEQIAA